jgi:hypothetical protein
LINFRFHLVSLVAVFLALALGIGMGATVIDKATVDSLKNRVTAVENDRNSANQRGDELQTQLDRVNAFDAAAESFVINGKLNNVPVVVIAVRGVDENPLNAVKKMVTTAGGQLTGTLWLPAKDALADGKSTSQLQADLGATSNDPNQLRQALMSLVSAVMAGATSPDAFKSLVNDGFLEWDGGTAGNDVTKVPFNSARILMCSGDQPAVPNAQLAIPLAQLLAVQPAKRLVAIESGRDPSGNTSGERSIFLDPLRADAAVKGHLATVDDIETLEGQEATVLALWQLGAGKVGNYGVAGTADAPVPVPAS